MLKSSRVAYLGAEPRERDWSRDQQGGSMTDDGEAAGGPADDGEEAGRSEDAGAKDAGAEMTDDGEDAGGPTDDALAPSHTAGPTRG